MAEHSIDPSLDHALARRRHWLLVLLAFHAGSLDALGFLALHAFTSVQTGNSVLIGVGLATGDGRLAFHAAVSITCFVVGCLLGAKVAGVARDDDPIWPRPVSTALLIQLVCAAVFAISWWLVHSDPGPAAKVFFLAMSSLGMGIQSAAVQRFGAAAESTTYTTGTLVLTLGRLANGGWSQRSTNSVQLLVAVAIGAGAGAILLVQLPWAPPLLQFVTLAFVIAAASQLKATSSRRAD